MLKQDEREREKVEEMKKGRSSKDEVKRFAQPMRKIFFGLKPGKAYVWTIPDEFLLFSLARSLFSRVHQSNHARRDDDDDTRSK